MENHNQTTIEDEAKKPSKDKVEVCEIKEYDLTYDTYYATIRICYSNKLTVSEMSEAIAKRENDDDKSPGNDAGDAAMVMTYPEKRLAYVIFDKESDITNVHHEVIHLTSFLFYLIQTDHNDATEEVFAYLSTSIFTQVYCVLTDHCKIKKKLFYLQEKDKAI